MSLYQLLATLNRRWLSRIPTLSVGEDSGTGLKSDRMLEWFISEKNPAQDSHTQLHRDTYTPKHTISITKSITTHTVQCIR